MKHLRVSLVQHSACGDAAANRASIERLVGRDPPADLVLLPEVCLLRGNREDYRAVAEPVPGPTAAWLADRARSWRTWLLAGSVPESAGGALYNTCLLFDREGTLRAAYRKMHLFEATLDTGEVVREGDTWSAGDTPVMADVEGWSCGFGICYDVRFPELFRYYAQHGAHLLFLPSNFTQRTGRDHWNVLVRSRAIENQCFVLAPGQCGCNPRTGIESHGHSLAVGPWGEVLAEADRDETRLDAVLDPARLREVRARIPVLEHCRLPPAVLPRD